MRAVIDDQMVGMTIVVHASGPYAPDVMVDLKNRAVECYREALVNRHSVMGAIAEGEGDE